MIIMSASLPESSSLAAELFELITPLDTITADVTSWLWGMPEWLAYEDAKPLLPVSSMKDLIVVFSVSALFWELAETSNFTVIPARRAVLTEMIRTCERLNPNRVATRLRKEAFAVSLNAAMERPPIVNSTVNLNPVVVTVAAVGAGVGEVVGAQVLPGCAVASDDVGDRTDLSLRGGLVGERQARAIPVLKRSK